MAVTLPYAASTSTRQRGVKDDVDDGMTDAGATTTATAAATTAAALASLAERCRRVELTCQHQQRAMEQLRVQAARLEERLTRSQGEMSYALQQLEFVVVNLEREHGIVADHTEQLRFFAHEAARHRSGAAGDEGRRSLLRLAANWLYVPVVNLVKGLYTLLSPAIHTVQSLSLFNSDVLQRHTEQHLRARWGDAAQGDLLGLLQRGMLDPAAALSQRKQASVRRRPK